MNNLFKDPSIVTVLGDEIYLIKNFLSQEECKYFRDVCDLTIAENGFRPLAESDFFKNIRTKYVPETKILFDKQRNVISDNYEIFQTPHLLKIPPRSFGWAVHADNDMSLEKRKKSKMFSPEQPYNLVENTIYGSVIYFSEFEGGEIYYPGQNIEYHPEPGDFLIHSAEDKCRHGVKPVLSGYRYSYSNNIFEYIKVPKENDENIS